MDNNMYTKPQFKCAICGEIYDDVKTRMECEAKCLKKQEIEAKKAAEAKRIAEQPARKAEVDAAYDLADKLRDEYVEDYGVYIRTSGDITNTVVGHDWLGLEEVFKLFH